MVVAKTCVIFCGGKGTRLSEETRRTPKPLLEINNGKPMVDYIMDHFRKFGVDRFILLVGYMAERFHERYDCEMDVLVLDTGIETNTGERLLKAKEHLKGVFWVTYGDGLSDVNLDLVEDTYADHFDMLLTITAVNPPNKFGAMEISKDGVVKSFQEKAKKDWINGGFMLCSKQVLNLINPGDSFEFDLIPRLVKDGKVNAFKHYGYWKCVDTLKDLEEARNEWN